MKSAAPHRLAALLFLAVAAPVFAATPPAGSSKPARAAKSAPQPVKVVYHISDGLEQASNGLRNIRNHLSADPTAKIVVVTHAGGINFLLEDAKDKNGSPYAAMVDDLVQKGIEFRVCNFTLQNRNIDPKLVHPEAKIVPSGVAEVSKLQALEKYVYLKP